jgi:predicted outer membrane repeat protein
MRKLILLFILAACSISFVFAQTVYRVNPSSTQTPDGLTWESGYKTISAALVAAGDTSPTVIEIWVKADTYNENFWLRNNVHIFGGFIGTESVLSERNYIVNATIIKPSDLTRKIIYRHGANSVKNGILDGFILTGSTIGGVYLNNGNILRHCTITGNTATGNGGGVYMDNGATLENCLITDNQGNNGGGIAGGHDNTKGFLRIINCEIVNNQANSDGGGVFVATYNLEMHNSLIANNSCGLRGGGFRFQTPVAASNITNCTFVNNSAAGNDGGMYLSTTASDLVFLTNNIIYGNKVSDNVNNININPNVSVSYTAIEELPTSLTESNNINLTSNQFVNPASSVGKQLSLPAYDWSLLETSHCINAGNNQVVFGSLDLAGNERIQKSTVDLGAYESPYGVASSINNVSNTSVLHFNANDNSLYTTKTLTNIKMYNLQGAMVFTKESATGKISLSKVNPGIYIITFDMGNQKLQQKLLLK